uniref:hypothetical protein n=1 Tax=Paractinoplanes polyasparticus TaxID=2856853 RepID=UPI001C8534AB|nr:hypothetical protein [Actinoplanes polyasparticus]
MSLDPLSALARMAARRHGVRSGSVWGDSVATNGLGQAIFGEFLGEALRTGAFTPAPEALAVGDGLERIPDALATVGRGVSARKVVVTLNGTQ